MTHVVELSGPHLYQESALGEKYVGKTNMVANKLTWKLEGTVKDSGRPKAK